MVGRYVVHTSFPNIESCVNKITVTVLYIIGPVLISMLSEGDFHERFAEGGRGGGDCERTIALLVSR